MQIGVLHQVLRCLQREYLAPGRFQELAHVFPSHPKTSPIHTGDDLERVQPPCLATGADGSQVLDPGDFVPGCAIIFGPLGLDHHTRIPLIGDDEIRYLVEALDAFGTLCSAETHDTCAVATRLHPLPRDQ